jgi:hypothetical protein
VNLKLDENLGDYAARLLRAAGHIVATVKDQFLEGTDDLTLIEVCRREQMCLVTLDLDFSNPLVFPPSRYAGLAVLRLPPQPSLKDVEDVVQALIAGLAERDIRGRLWSVQRGRVREYQPGDPEPGDQ